MTPRQEIIYDMYLDKYFVEWIEATAKHQFELEKRRQEVYANYVVPISRHRRFKKWLHWHTIGRFKHWLHKDYGY